MDLSSENVGRPLVDFPQGIDSDFFFESQVDSLQMEAYAKEIDELKEQVRAMVVDISTDHKHKLELIDVADRLGVSYHSQEEILNQLDFIFKAYDYQNNYDLYTVSVHFRVFRQHGYKMTCDVFNKFKDIDGGLQVALKGDVKGILSLYEAAHLMMHGEDFLEEALDLTTNILSLIASSESNLEADQCLHKQVIHATRQPLHKGIKIMESRYFIGFYEEDESRNETLLRLAKLDFNMLQLLHRIELKQIIKWWDDLNVKTELPYLRNRSIESHFWALAMGSNPCHSQGRLITAKVIQMMTVIDDTYDSYGVIEELDLLTQAFERRDKDAIDELSVEMKSVFTYVFNFYDGLKEMVSEQREYEAPYAKERILEMIKTYYTEAKWANKGYIPSYKEYMDKAGYMTAGSQPMISAFMMGMDATIANKNRFDWIINPVPPIIRANEVIARVMNGITSHKDQLASTLKCYMNEHGATEEEAVIPLKKVVKDAWKDLNEELVRLRLMNVPPVIIDLITNLASIR